MADGQMEQIFSWAKERYQDIGVDVDAALRRLSHLSLSIHCWQGDDVTGFEPNHATLAGSGLVVTGSCPGRARSPAELRQDMEKALSLIPGKHRVNLHAMYCESQRPVDRDALRPEHFRGWMEWAKEKGLGVDFNATLFAHPQAASGFTLSSSDESIRRFWVEHVRRTREIAAFFGLELENPCIHNLWIPDGEKDAVVDRWERRSTLRKSLDEAFSYPYSTTEMKDALEGKLWGIGSESFVVGSYDFYVGYALSRGMMPCLDTGHFHPTESVADKVSALLQFSSELMVHVSRGVRWDSDHVAVCDDTLRELVAEVVRAAALSRVHFALDYFDAGMNRVAAWVIGARATLKALLAALLEPAERLRELDQAGRLALLEEARAMPLGVIWDYHCVSSGVPPGGAWMEDVRKYESKVLSARE